jgi:hypothetical protein
VALTLRRNPNGYFMRITPLKRLFWLYFLLLIFEGSLRKWVLPQFSAPLLIVRDPVAIIIILQALRTNKWPRRWTSVIGVLTVLLLGLFILQIIAGGNPVIVGLYGLRSYLLPFPLIFIMGENLDEEDLGKLGACTLWLLLPMTLLVVAQYLAPGSSPLNNGAYEGGSQIAYAGAHVRASGTFSFVIGESHFATLAGAFIFYGLVKEGFAKTWMLWAGAFALMLSVPMTGSRTLVFQLTAIIVCVGLGAIMGVSQFGKALRVILPLVIVAFLVSFFPVFSDASKDMTDRLVGSAGVEGGGSEGQTLYKRTAQPAITSIEDAVSGNNWLGIGIGRGAVAVQVFLHGSNEAVAGEDETSREMVEMGPVAGILFVLFKLFFAATMFGRALARAREHEPLALLLVPLALATFFFGVPEQPTIQGFLVVSMAFCIAASRVSAQAAGQLLPLAIQRQQLLYRRRV